MAWDKEPDRAEIFRAMSPEQKYALFQQLMITLRNLKRAGVRAKYPEWSDAAVESEVAKIFLRSHT